MIRISSKQITLIKALQDTFKKYMGRIQRGDKFIPIFPSLFNHEIKFCHDTNDRNNPITYDGFKITEWEMKNCFLYPDIYSQDEDQRQRGLIGMLGNDLRGFRRINGDQWIVETYDKKPDSQVEPFIDDTIELALYQAILWKEGLYDLCYQSRKEYP
jgi:hypothetical protein